MSSGSESDSDGRNAKRGGSSQSMHTMLDLQTLDAQFKLFAFLRPMRKHLPYYVRRARRRMQLPPQPFPEVPRSLVEAPTAAQLTPSLGHI